MSRPSRLSDHHPDQTERWDVKSFPAFTLTDDSRTIGRWISSPVSSPSDKCASGLHGAITDHASDNLTSAAILTGDKIRLGPGTIFAGGPTKRAARANPRGQR